MKTTLNTAVAMALAVGGVAGGVGVASAQSVEFRIVQVSTSDSVARTAPLPHAPTAPTQNYAVQARVIGGPGLAGFGFNIVITGEADTNGTLSRLRIQNSDETYYWSVPTTSATGGTHVGLANQYFGLAASNANYNGLINTSGGTFTNTTLQQEIGSVGGYASGPTMLATPGMDPNGEGNPVTWSLYGFGLTPTNGSTAILNPSLAPGYFATGFIDIYRFRYTVSNTSNRVLNFTLASPTAQTFTLFQYSGGAWGPIATNIAPAQMSVTPLNVGVGVSGACCTTTGGCSVQAHATCNSPNTWDSGGTCSVFNCPQPGVCCDTAGFCTYVLPSLCAGTWGGVQACTTTICVPLGVCCTLTGCVVLQAGQTCVGRWVAGPCTTNACILGSCCQKLTCQFLPESACPEWTWTGEPTCTPNPCLQPTLGVCCTVPVTPCTVTTHAACPSPNTWEGWGVCSPLGVHCSTVSANGGTCCTVNGTCASTLPSQCTGNWIPNSVPGGCSTLACEAPTGACCRGATCVVSSLSDCAGSGNQFTGANLACNAGGGYPCCAANYNQADGVGVQDIFDYLAGWFAGDVRADADGSGALGVQDIFDFLNTWFAGC